MFKCRCILSVSKFLSTYSWLIVTVAFTSVILNLLSYHSLSRKKKDNDSCTIDEQEELVLGLSS